TPLNRRFATKNRFWHNLIAGSSIHRWRTAWPIVRPGVFLLPSIRLRRAESPILAQNRRRTPRPSQPTTPAAAANESPPPFPTTSPAWPPAPLPTGNATPPATSRHPVLAKSNRAATAPLFAATGRCRRSFYLPPPTHTRKANQNTPQNRLPSVCVVRSKAPFAPPNRGDETLPPSRC